MEVLQISEEDKPKPKVDKPKPFKDPDWGTDRPAIVYVQDSADGKRLKRKKRSG